MEYLHLSIFTSNFLLLFHVVYFSFLVCNNIYKIKHFGDCILNMELKRNLRINLNAVNQCTKRVSCMHSLSKMWFLEYG